MFLSLNIQQNDKIEPMSNRARFLQLVILVVLTLFFECRTPAVAQENSDHSVTKYNLDSIHGEYAVVATYGANVARALGVQNFDGFGNLTGSAKVNQPGPNGTRQTSHLVFKGTYSVNNDGTGKMLLTIFLATGGTATVTEDFVITRTQLTSSGPLATEIVDQQEQPSAAIDDNVLVTHAYTRRQR